MMQFPKISVRWYIAVLAICLLLDAVRGGSHVGCVNDGKHDFTLHIEGREVLRIPGLSPC